MVKIESIRDYMRSQAEEDRNRKWIQVEGENLDDALRQAAIELGLPVKKLEYEIRIPGKKGSFGFGKSRCVIIAYPLVLETKTDMVDDGSDFGIARFDDRPVDKDGEIVVRLTSAGALISVLPPVGKGKIAVEKQALARLNYRNVTDINHRLLSEVVKNADGSPVKVGEFIYNPASDPIISIEITDFEMKSFITVRAPGKGGTDRRLSPRIQ